MSISARYRTILAHVTGEPRTATQVYKSWAGLADHQSLTRHHRNERRWLAKALENLANERVIERDNAYDRLITFKRVDTDAAGQAEPARARSGERRRRSV